MRILLSLSIAAILIATAACRSAERYLAEGDRLFAAKKYADSVIIYRKAIQKNPKSAEAYYKLGLAQRAANDNSGAFASLLQAVALNPDLDSAQIELGDLCLGDYLMEPIKQAPVYQRIAQIADRLLAKDPKSYSGLRFRGYLAISDRKPEQALSYFRQADAVKPMQPDVILGLAQAMLMEGRYDGARKTAMDLIAKDKSFGPVYDVLYQYQISAGHTDDAEALLKLKISNNPQKPEFVLQLAEHYRRAGKREDAYKLLDAMLQTNVPGTSYLSAADFYARAAEWDRAIRVLDMGIQAHPAEKLPFEKRRAEVLALQGKREQAIRILDDVLKKDPSAVDARKARAVLLLGSNDTAEKGLALRELENLAGISPNDRELAFQLGRAYAWNGMPDKAKKQFELILKQNENHLPALLALAELSSNAKEFQQTLRFSERVLAIDPKLRNARLLHATALIGLGQLDQARNEYLNLTRDNPQYTEAKLQLALLNVAQKRFGEAEKQFRELYRPRDGDFRALTGLVEVYAAQNQLEKALALVTSELNWYPNSIAVRQLLAATAVRASKLELAVQEYEQIVRLQPDNLQACGALGELYQRLHNLSRSIQMHQKARELAPNDWKTAARLATVQQEAGLLAEAKSNYDRAIQLGADAPDLFNNLAYLEAELGSNLDDALTYAKMAVTKSPTDPGYADTVGFVYLKQKATTSALQVFKTLSERYPTNAVYRYHLALALLQKGDTEQAKRELRAALDADSSLQLDPSAKELLNSIGY